MNNDQYIVEVAFEDVYYNPGIGRINSGIEILEGNGRQVFMVSPPSFNIELSRLDDLISMGEIEERDLKGRFDGCNVKRQEKFTDIYLAVGPTQFHECKGDMGLPDERITFLKELGELHGYGQGSYLTRGLGVSVLPLTTDGKLVVGQRANEEYTGELQAPAGWMTFFRDVARIDPKQDAYRELKEETGVIPGAVERMDLIGMVSYPKTLETDIMFLGKLKRHNANHFVKGIWKENIPSKEREHKEFYAYDCDEIYDLLNSDVKIVSSTRYALEKMATLKGL